MRKRLNWSVGKFAYIRGSSTPIHFMELRDFCLDPSLDMSLMVAMRVVRVTRSSEPIEQQLHDWGSRLAVTLVGDLADAVLRSRPDITAVTEFSPRIGFVYEHLKMLREHQKTDVFSYRAIGPEELRQAFDMMHANNGYDYEYAAEDEDNLQLHSPSCLTIYNHNHLVRQESEPAFDWPGLVGEVPAPAVISMRVAESEEGKARTSIHGRDMVLPQIDEAISTLAAQDGNWRFRYIGHFDEEFFLPPAHRVGLLLGYNAGVSLELDRFEAEISQAARRRSRYS